MRRRTDALAGIETGQRPEVCEAKAAQNVQDSRIQGPPNSKRPTAMATCHAIFCQMPFALRSRAATSARFFARMAAQPPPNAAKPC